VLEKYDARINAYQATCLSELPKYSSWPKRLLGLEEFKQRLKNKQEVLREYEKEKWGELLKLFKKKDWSSFSEFRDSVNGGHSLLPRSWKDRLFLLGESDFNHLQADILADILTHFLPSGNIVELGCGFGGMLLDVAGRRQLKQVQFIGGDIAPSGVELVNLMAKKFDLKVQAHAFDFENFNKSLIPADAIILTSFSLSCFDRSMEKNIEDFMSARPKVVIHLEPVNCQANKDDLLSLMRKRYLEVNGYNGDLGIVLKGLEKIGSIKILAQQEHFLGANPFIPVSLIIWKPV